MSFSPLYRPEAVQHFRERLYGEVRLSRDETHWAYSVLIGLLLLLVLAALFGVSYPRRQTVSGWLQPDLGRMELRADAPAVVDAVLVQPGQAVRAGQPLVLLRSPKSARDGSPANGAQAAALQREGQQLRLQQEQVQAQSLLRQARLRQERALLQQEVALLRQQMEAQTHRIEIARQQHQQTEALVRQGFSPQQDAQKTQVQWLEARQALGELEQRLLLKQQEVAQREHDIRRQPVDEAAQRAALEERLASVQQQAAEADQRQQWAINAPANGKVLRLALKPGQSASADTVLAELLPEGAALEAELYAGSAAITELREGATVRLRLDAYPHEKYGSLRGRLRHIEPTSTQWSAAALAQLPFGVPRGPVYILRVQIEPQELPLRPGMSLQADVILERRRLIEFLLAPLLAVRGALH